jgi:nucleotide sugar dehydrogenase
MPRSDNLDEYDVVVFGLGFVGLTLSVVFAEVGLNVLGIDSDKNVLRNLKAKIPHFYERGLEESLKRGIETGNLTFSDEAGFSNSKRAYVICVGTPLKGNQLDRSSIQNVILAISALLKPDDLVILRSTVSIGMTEYIRGQIQEGVGFDFDIAMCPERTLEGIAMLELRSLPQIVGAPNHKSREVATNLFKRITTQIVEVDSFEAAEISKLANNIVRDVRFALANEIAFACETFGVDFQEVKRASTMGYPRDGLAQAGPVAGPCLEKDAWIFLESLHEKHAPDEIKNSVLRSARLVNESLPEYVVSQVEQFLENDFKNSSVLHVGIAFKGTPPTDDIRGSNSLKVIEYFLPKCSEQFGVDFEVEDRVLQNFNLKKISKEYFESDSCVIIIHNNHDKNRLFVVENLTTFSKSSKVFILDLWNLFDSSFVWPDNFCYKSLGRQ